MHYYLYNSLTDFRHAGGVQRPVHAGTGLDKTGPAPKKNLFPKTLLRFGQFKREVRRDCRSYWNQCCPEKMKIFRFWYYGLFGFTETFLWEIIYKNCPKPPWTPNNPTLPFSFRRRGRGLRCFGVFARSLRDYKRSLREVKRSLREVKRSLREP